MTGPAESTDLQLALDFLSQELPAHFGQHFASGQGGPQASDFARLFLELQRYSIRCALAVLVSKLPEGIRDSVYQDVSDILRSSEPSTFFFGRFRECLEKIEEDIVRVAKNQDPSLLFVADGLPGSLAGVAVAQGSRPIDLPVGGSPLSAWVKAFLDTFHFWWEYAIGRVTKDGIRLLKGRFADILLPLPEPSIPDQDAHPPLLEGHFVLLSERRETIWDITPFVEGPSLPTACPGVPSTFPISSRQQDILLRQEEARLERLRFRVLEFLPKGKAPSEFAVDSLLPIARSQVQKAANPSSIIDFSGSSTVLFFQSRAGQKYVLKILRFPQDPVSHQNFDREMHFLRWIACQEALSADGRDVSDHQPADGALKVLRRYFVTYRGFGVVEDSSCRITSRFLLLEYVDGNLEKTILRRTNERERIFQNWPEKGMCPAKKAWIAKEYLFAMYVVYRISDALVRIRSAVPDFEHRDLKPSNLLGGRESLIRLCDFNSAPDGTSSRETGGNLYWARLALTPRYCAPYVWADPLSKADSTSADVFSIGRILQEILSFRSLPPYDGLDEDFRADFHEFAVTNHVSDLDIDDWINSCIGNPVKQPGFDKLRRYSMDVSRSLRRYLSELCISQIETVRKNPTLEGVHETLHLLSVSLGYSSSFSLLRSPFCHECKARPGDEIQKIIAYLKQGLPLLQKPLSVRDGMVFLEKVRDCLVLCPGIVDLPDEGWKCVDGHSAFSDANTEILSRTPEVADARPDLCGPLARSILDWIGRSVSSWRIEHAECK